MSKILVIPDVHGRDFWKTALKWDGEIIFLGDYHDPYPWNFNPNGKYQAMYGNSVVRYDEVSGDYISNSFENFQQIIEFARNNKDRVTLLIGNHDAHYIDTTWDSSRKDEFRVRLIHDLIEDNLDLFKGCFLKDGVLFTHAGLCQEWCDTYGVTLDKLSDLILKCPNIIMDCSFYRGGTLKVSGPIWLDVNEVDKYPLLINKDIEYQVFGHTQLPDTGSTKKVLNGVCLDSRATFIFNTETKSIEI